MECLYIKVLDVGAVVGETPGDAVIVADDDEGTAGQSKSFDIPAGRCEMRLVPDRRNREFEMRVVGEKRFARGGVRAAYDPVVAAECAANVRLRFVNPIFDLRSESGR